MPTSRSASQGLSWPTSLRSNLFEGFRDAIWRLHPGYRRAVGRLDRNTALFIHSALAISGKSIFVDATKDPVRSRHLRRLDGE